MIEREESQENILRQEFAHLGRLASSLGALVPQGEHRVDFDTFFNKNTLGTASLGAQLKSLQTQGHTDVHLFLHSDEGAMLTCDFKTVKQVDETEETIVGGNENPAIEHTRITYIFNESGKYAKLIGFPKPILPQELTAEGTMEKNEIELIGFILHSLKQQLIKAFPDDISQ